MRDASFCSVGELRNAVLEFIAFWNREKAHPFRWTFTGYPLNLASSKKLPEESMKTRKRSSMSKPTDQQAQQLCHAIHSLGDYEHVSVRAERGHLNIYTDEYGPVARFSPLGGGSTASVSASTPDAGNLFRWRHIRPTISSLTRPTSQKWDF